MAQDRILTPQQELFLEGYLTPTSPTWGNALQSALKAGYSREYSENITNLMPLWLKGVLDDNSLVQRALDNLSDYIGNSKNQNIQWDATKFVLTTLGKNKFSTRNELTGKDGKDLFNPEKEEQANKAISSFLNDNNRRNTTGE